MFMELDERTYVLLVLAVLYVVEGFAWISRASVLFHWGPFSRYAFIRYGSLISDEQGGFTFLGHWPSSYAFLGQQWPVSISPVGAFAYVATSFGDERSSSQSEHYLAWDDFQSVCAVDCEVRINVQPFAIVGIPSFAELLAQELQKLASTDSGDKREQQIRLLLERSLSIPEARKRVQAINRVIRPLVGFSLALWFTAFILAPVVFWMASLTAYSLAVYAALGLQFVLLYLTVILLYRSAVKQMQAVLPETLRFKDHTWSLLVSPVAAMWAADRLSRDCFADLHPLAIAAASCTSDQFHEFARRVLRDVRQPILPVCPECEPEAAQAEHWFREQLQVAIERAIIDVGIHPDELLNAPSREPDTHSYCPRCERQYRLIRGSCHMCGGVELEPYSLYSISTHQGSDCASRC